MTFDIRHWLEGLGLGEYAERFAQNDVDAAVLVELTGEDLREIGVASVGHRRRLLGAIARLANPPSSGTARPQDDQLPIAAPTPPAEAERRSLAVAMIDLVGSTELSSRFDPEDLRGLLRRYQDTVVAAIVRHDGYVANIVGDGIVAYFGWPKAFENQAVQAVRAALAAVAAVQEIVLAEGTRLAARAGVATGPVVVGDLVGAAGRQAGAISGEAPNLAARLQGLAEINGVAIDAATHRLTAWFFDCADIGAHVLKGFAAPIQVFRVLGESGVQDRLEIGDGLGLTPLVGREEEMAFLRRRWEQVRQGQGQVVLIEGEPGIGKSRLTRTLAAELAGETAMRMEWRCSPYHQSSAFHPPIERLRQTLGFARDDSDQDRLEKLETMLAACGLTADQTVPILATLLSLAVPSHYAPPTQDPERLKQQTLAVLVDWLRATAERQPVLLIVEDLHWIDPSTLELLGLLVERLGALRLLQLFTFRSDFRPPWPMLPQLAQLKLNRLARDRVETMVASIAGGDGLASETILEVVNRTDGVPLFVEELTKAVMELGQPQRQSAMAGVKTAWTVPSSLQDLLMARLDRLAEAKEIAQLGAVIGREFDYELIEAVSPLDRAALQAALARLVEAELIYQRGRPPQARYSFKHALIQDAAYQSLLRSSRQRHHARIAQAITERLPETIDIQPELLAHHYSEAGLGEQALPHWQAAGQRSIRRSANLEAIEHLRRGLEIVGQLPDTPDNARREFDLQIAIGVPLKVTRGFAAPEVGKAYSRALELHGPAGETADLVPVLRGLWEWNELRAEYRQALQFAERLLKLAERLQDPAARLIAHNVLGDTLFWLGDFAAAHAHLERAIKLYDRERDRAHALLYGYDTAVACLSFDSWALWALGYPDQALRRVDEALALARTLDHPFSFAFALQFSAQLHQYRREFARAREQTAELLTISIANGFPLTSSMGAVVHGWALAREGSGQGAIAEIEGGIALWRNTGHELERPHFLGLLADAHAALGQPAQGLAAVAEARADADRTGEEFWDAELYRLQGELLLDAAASPIGGSGSGATTDPHACFLKAIEIARRQQAKSFELRASVSLGRLWLGEGRRDEALALVGTIHGWFSEGFETPDLIEARALLDELRGSR